MKKAYIFRGSPASGKTTLTKKYIKQFSGKCALLELDTFRWNFHLTNREICEVSLEEHYFAYKNFLMMLESYCKNETYDLVIEGLFAFDKKSPHGNMQEIMYILNKYNYKYEAFVLMADFETLWNRNLKRDYSVPRDEFIDLYNNVVEKIGKNEIIIDVGQTTPRESLVRVINFIKKKELLPSDN